ncbi:MAG TPA: C1 family peptidase [Polyangiaceae bacterium]|nr:C1 family peptidase [Polyangiaceae bacterium]
MSFGKGLERCPAEKVAHRFQMRATATPKGAGQLTPCQRLDQGQTSTCHAHSLVAAVWTALAAAGTTPPFVGSPRQLAACTYSDVRARRIPVGQTLPTLGDNGADLQDDATALAAWGLAPIQAPTSDGRFSDCENDPSSGVFPEPDPTQLQRVMQVTGEYSIPVDSSAPATVATCIDAGIPVQVGIFIDTAFEELSAGHVAQPANERDPNGGGHAMYISGYRTNSAGELEFRVENSWGSTWCEGGACWASTAWLLSAWELFPVAVKAVQR